MRRYTVCLAGLTASIGLALAVTAFAPAQVAAQSAVGIDPGRDCQTVRTCNFSRHARVRGCLSSYTCRTCRTVTVRCNLAGHTRCQQLVCSWGG